MRADRLGRSGRKLPKKVSTWMKRAQWQSSCLVTSASTKIAGCLYNLEKILMWHCKMLVWSCQMHNSQKSEKWLCAPGMRTKNTSLQKQEWGPGECFGHSDDYPVMTWVSQISRGSMAHSISKPKVAHMPQLKQAFWIHAHCTQSWRAPLYCVIYTALRSLFWCS